MFLFAKHRREQSFARDQYSIYTAISLLAALLSLYQAHNTKRKAVSMEINSIQVRLFWEIFYQMFCFLVIVLILCILKKQIKNKSEWG